MSGNRQTQIGSLLLLVLSMIVGSGTLAQETDDKIGFSATVKGWLIPNGDVGFDRSDLSAQNISNRFSDDFTFGDNGAMPILELRYESQGLTGFWYVNLSVGYNGFIDGHAENNHRLTRATDNSLVSTLVIDGDVDGVEWEICPTIGGGMKVLDWFTFEAGVGFYLRQYEAEIEEVDIFSNNSLILQEGGKFADYSLDVYAMILEFTLKVPVDPDDRLWLKFKVATMPYSALTSVYDEERVGNWQPTILEQRGHDTFNSYLLEAAVIGYLYRDSSFALCMEIGYRYFHWRPRGDIEEKFTDETLGINREEGEIVGFVQIHQHGPYVAVTAEF